MSSAIGNIQRRNNCSKIKIVKDSASAQPELNEIRQGWIIVISGQSQLSAFLGQPVRRIF
jgi:hypothetical protein